MTKLEEWIAEQGNSGVITPNINVVNGIKVLTKRLDGADAKGLRAAVDRIKAKLRSSVIVLGSVQGEKVLLVAGVTHDLIGRLNAGALVNEVALQVGGRGGGRADMAQAGGTEPSKLDAALAAVPKWIAGQLH